MRQAVLELARQTKQIVLGRKIPISSKILFSGCWGRFLLAPIVIYNGGEDQSLQQQTAYGHERSVILISRTLAISNLNSLRLTQISGQNK
jgi:hypothetical protein